MCLYLCILRHLTFLAIDNFYFLNSVPLASSAVAYNTRPPSLFGITPVRMRNTRLSHASSHNEVAVAVCKAGALVDATMRCFSWPQSNDVKCLICGGSVVRRASKYFAINNRLCAALRVLNVSI